MKIAVISIIPNKESLWIDEFVKPISIVIKNQGHSFEIIDYKDVKDLSKYDKVIISGSPLGDFEANENIKYFKWIQEFEKPILGICGGMQIITQVYGCELEDSLEIGLQYIKPIAKNPLFDEEIQVYQLHAKGVVLNDNFNILATNENGVQVIKHKEKEIYGVLFHPEVRNHEIIENFLKL